MRIQKQRVGLVITSLCVLWFIFGCSSFKQNNSRGANNLLKLPQEATFQNSVSDSSTRYFLWTVLSYHQESTKKSQKDDVVHLQIDEHLLKAYLLRNLTIIDSIFIPGKHKAVYFLAKSKKQVIPIPLLYGSIKRQQIQLACDMRGQLAIDYLDYRWGWFLFFFADTGGVRSFRYPSSH